MTRFSDPRPGRFAALAATTGLALSALTLALTAPAAHAQTTNFNNAGVFNYSVPTGFTSLSVVVRGAGGASQATGAVSGGAGGALTATLTNLTPGSTLTVFVGASNFNEANGSINGSGQFSAIAFGAGQTYTSLLNAGAANTPLPVLAGGGGSSSTNNVTVAGSGGAGGGLTGANGSNSPDGSGGGGTGGTQTNGGNGGVGFFGGGGANGRGGGGGGGGGSSFSSATPSTFNGFFAVTNVVNTQGGGGSAGTGTFSVGGVGSVSITPTGAVSAAPEPGSLAFLAVVAVPFVGVVRRKRDIGK